MHILLRSLLAAVLVSSVHAQRDGKLFLVPVLVNGRGPYWFCVDSGAPHSVIDPTIVKDLGLKSIGSTTIKGTGEGSVPVVRTEALTMAIGRAKVNVAEPWVIDLSEVPIPKFVHGLVGAEWFEAYAMEMSSERSTLRFFDASTFRTPRGATTIPLEDTDHRLFMNVTIDVTKDETVTRRVRIDTGSSDSVGDEIAKHARTTQTTTLGNGLGTNYQSVSGLMDGVHIGPFTFRNVWGPATHSSNIGMEMLRRFTVTFDVPHRAMHLRPNRFFAEPVPPPEE